VNIPTDLLYKTYFWLGLSGIIMFFAIQILLWRKNWRKAFNQSSVWIIAYLTMYAILKLTEYYTHMERIPRIGNA